MLLFSYKRFRPRSAQAFGRNLLLCPSYAMQKTDFHFTDDIRHEDFIVDSIIGHS